MQIIHRLVGYDAQTDRVKLRFDIPDGVMPDAKKIAKVPADDPDAAWSYPLTEAQTRRFAPDRGHGRLPRSGILPGGVRRPLP